MPCAVLLDLDETLIEEEPAAAAAFEATAAFAFAQTGDGLDTCSSLAAARAKARELWRASSSSDYCTAIGISSTEGLWCGFDGDDTPTGALRKCAFASRVPTAVEGCSRSGASAKRRAFSHAGTPLQ